MGKKRGAWIRGKTHSIYPVGGYAEGYAWRFQLCINTKTGRITTKLDRPVLNVVTLKKRNMRSVDRKWFVSNCGRKFMVDKEVDHDWDSDMVWCRVVSPMENGNRHEVQTPCRSFVEIEPWLQELYPGKRR
jgi:hypothetical protein